MYCQLCINSTDMVLKNHPSVKTQTDSYLGSNSKESWLWALCDLGLHKQPHKPTLETTHTPLNHCG